ncbi:MAG: DUF1501 domain-containing protein, partial [Pirellula staleyi]
MTVPKNSFCGRTRRTFLSNLGMGFGGIALNSLLQQDGLVRSAESSGHVRPDGKPHFAPKARN